MVYLIIQTLLLLRVDPLREIVQSLGGVGKWKF